MDWLKRNFWLVNVLTIAACSTSLAWAAGHVIESKLLETPSRRATLMKPAAPAVMRQKDVDVILKRNLFCSDCPPLIDTGPTPGSDSAGSNDPTKTSQPLQLVTVPTDLEQEYNEFYDKEHLADTLRTPGYARARRFLAVDPDPSGRYAVIYEMERLDAMTPEHVHRLQNTPWAKKMDVHRFVNLFKKFSLMG